MKITSELVLEKLDIMYPDAHCELNYKKDYELLIATVLSAQSTDKRVNLVTKKLFDRFDIYGLSKAPIQEIEEIIKPVGTFKRKAIYIKEIASYLVRDFDGNVPNNRLYLENLPGVGRKTCNVVLSNLYNVPAIAVDTHVSRVSKRLNLARKNDDVSIIEKKLMKKFRKEEWSKRHHQMVLFGRYYCKAQKPSCKTCKLINICKEKNKEI